MYQYIYYINTFTGALIMLQYPYYLINNLLTVQSYEKKLSAYEISYICIFLDHMSVKNNVFVTKPRNTKRHSCNQAMDFHFYCFEQRALHLITGFNFLSPAFLFQNMVNFCYKFVLILREMKQKKECATEY